VFFDASTLVPIAPGLSSLLAQLSQQFAALENIARSRRPILIQGETGTGKEIVARAIHLISGRKGDFVAVNCRALTPNQIQAELFGYKKGALSGTTEDRTGLIRSAEGGTLFLDEVGDFPPDSQVAILRAIEQGEVTPVGGTRPVSVDVRFCVATHRRIDELVLEGQFREDLFARLNGFAVQLPPLRERREDLGLIIAAILQRTASIRPESVTFTPKAALALIRFNWPRNIRELEKALEGALILAAGRPISLKYLPGALRSADDKPSVEPPDTPSSSSTGVTNQGEERKERLEELLAEHQGNVSAVARALGKARLQISRWLKSYDLDPEDFRKQ
jgi:DNA-binding NtrC family response regulator